MTDAEYTAWLSTPSAMRCILIEASVNVSGVETVRYLSNRGYVTGAADTPANTVYRSLIKGGVKITESLSISSEPTISVGEVTLINDNGELDTWLEDVWDSRSISIYFGDMKWARSDFRLIVKGMLSGVGSQNRNEITLFLRDSLQRLNTPITDTKLGGSTVNKDKLLPLVFGEVHNITPLLVDDVLHDYKVHNGAIESIIEFKDNGVPISITPTLGTGVARLANAPFGNITASVQGSKPSTYSNQITDIIKNIVKNWGQVDKRLTDADIDGTNFTAFAAANTAPVGIYIDNKANVLEVCQQLANSVGAQVTMSRTGLLQLLRIDFPPSGTPKLITASNMVAKSLRVANREDVQAAVQIGYCKNWTVQDNLPTIIPDAHKELYAREWLTAKASDSAVATKYKLQTEPTQKDTLLLVASDASAEATRLLNIVKEQRTVYEYVGFADALELVRGQAVTLKHSRFGLSAGELGVVVGLEPQYGNEVRVNVKVMI